MRDKPWLMRTYSGHSSARASNELYRSNLSRGQTGLSVAFDLPTQTGYDADHPLARGEVGKVGVPVPYLGAMRTLFEGIPLDAMNTSMTINATAMWLFGMYLALAEERGVDPAVLAGTTQNDIVKEYLSRGTYIFGPEPSRRLTVDLVCHAVRHVPKWNPINVCSYHLQEAGATPVEEVAYALATAIDVLDAVRESGQVSEDEFPEVVGRISFFVNAGIRFVEEMCKLRAFGQLWDRITPERYGVTDDKLRRFRYGVQVNSLGFTEAQPENNVQRIVLETLGVTLSKGARARAVQLPAWNEALGLPRPWDQQWSLRIQQVLAFETDLLEYDDLFAGSHVVEAKTAELAEAAEAELRVGARRRRRVRHDRRHEATAGAEQRRAGAPHRVRRHHRRRRERVHRVGAVAARRRARRREQHPRRRRAGRARAARRAGRVAQRDVTPNAVARAVADVQETARGTDNLTPATIALARVGGTVGEWAGALREVFGEYRAPTGVGGVRAPVGEAMVHARERVAARVQALGHPIRILVGKPGLDGHSNGAEQIAVAARDAGMEVVYQGIRLTPEQIAAAARDEDVDLVGLSVLSGSHRQLVPETVRLLRANGVDAPVVVGGIIPEADQPELLAAGVARVYTPKDFRISDIVAELAELVTDRP